MKLITLATLGVVTAACVLAQPAGDPKTQEKVAAIKQSIEQNQAQLKQYSWVETTTISLKGEVKKTEQKSCMYGADGKVVKTAIAGAPQQQPQDSGGGGRRGGRGGKVKAKVIENKVEDLKEYMAEAAALIKQYVPPNPQTMQASLKAGKAAIDKASGHVVFSDYAKPGDKVTLTFDSAAKKLSGFDVSTYLDKPQDTVTLKANFSRLEDGTSYMQESVLDVKAKNVVVKTTNGGYKKAR